MLNKLPQAARTIMYFAILNAIKKRNPLNYKIISMERTRLPIDIIKTLTPTIDASCYRVKVFNKKTHFSGWIDKTFILMSPELLTLTSPTIEECNRYPILRELEDYLSNKAIGLSNAAWIDRYNSEINIDNIKRQLDSIVANHVDLQIASHLFYQTPGFNDLLIEVIEIFHRSSQQKQTNSHKGKLFELECAIAIVMVEKRSIDSFTKKLHSPNAKQEFDIETSDDELIECKYTEHHIDKSKLTVKAKVALHHNKKFSVWIAQNISNELKDWLHKNNIAFREGLKKNG